MSALRFFFLLVSGQQRKPSYSEIVAISLLRLYVLLGKRNFNIFISLARHCNLVSNFFVILSRTNLPPEFGFRHTLLPHRENKQNVISSGLSVCCRLGVERNCFKISSKEGSSWDVALNQAAVEALYSATYIEDYLDCVENLPDDVQRNLSQLRELDVKYQEVLAELEQLQCLLEREELESRKKVMLQIQRSLIRSQELGDDKLQLLQQIQDLIENKARQLDLDYKNLDHEPETREAKRSRSRRAPDDDLPHPAPLHPTSAHQVATVVSHLQQQQHHPQHHQQTTTCRKQPKKKKRRGGGAAVRAASPAELPIDPDEPTYCLCEQVSFGEMICCDNEECAIEWFHFSCVSLTTKPKGKWYCPRCRGDRSNQPKTKATTSS